MKYSVGNARVLPDTLDLDIQAYDLRRPLDSVGGGESRTGQHTGVKALMLAVLEEGIRNYLGTNTRHRSEAAYWILSNERRSPFAFGIVCETLGLEPEAVRVALKRLRAQNLSARAVVRRTRPNVRHTARLAVQKIG